jgi:hypothetical protein
MSSKTGKARKLKRSQSLKVKTEAASFLRTVDAHEAFHFYEGIGKPTGQSATSLPDLLSKVKSIKAESLLFHVERKDFENWIEKTLGDLVLAERIERMGHKHGGDLRTRIQSILEKRIEQLNESCLTIVVDPGLTVSSQNSMP